MQGSLWTTRAVDAPVDNHLTAEQVGKLFGFGVETLDRLVKAGEFPEPVLTSPKTKLWDWRACAYYQLRIEMRPRLKSEAGSGDEK
jgi:predicted DNA-binding transcriptional regulator AlpA